MDTKKSIQSYIDRGLAGLHELRTARARGGDLREWIILGRWHLGYGGGFSKCTIEPALKLQDVVSVEELHGVLKDVWVTSTIDKPFVFIDDVCTLCGKGWTIEDADLFVDGNHTACHNFERYMRGAEHFARIFSDAGVEAILGPIENKYWGKGWAPWFEARTRHCTITIGWRKHVISIEWDRGALAEDLFKDEDVTKLERLVHAWSRDKAIEYLKCLNSSF